MVIDGKKIAAQILRRLKITTQRQAPTLAIVQVGHRPDSDSYIRQKVRAAAIAGITTQQIHCQPRAAQASVVAVLRKLSLDQAVDGILLQLPVPSHLDTERLLQSIDPKKDVDGFLPHSSVQSPLIQAIERCLRAGKRSSGHVVLLGRESIFSRSLETRLQKKGFSVQQHDGLKRIPPATKKADVIITARGQGPRLFPTHLKKGALVIDVGIRRFEHGIIGDADTTIASVAGAYTPVPGGIGPLTVAYALKNVTQLKKRARG